METCYLCKYCYLDMDNNYRCDIKKYPESNVTFQTIRNWASKYGFGKKKNFLPRSEWIIDDKKFNDFLHFRNNLSYAQQQQFDELFQDNPVMENLIADTSKEVMEVAAHLFLGQVEAAGQIALSHGGGGGGGGSSSGWGRSKDDDDDLWWRKCMARAKHMMKKSSGQGLKR